ncbi:MAG: hypothetical protein JWP63_3175 [Candidatus Solibacter sp.]|jgi:hypothetical protein|nr:hypothetical protein [Candidatus Solibacter sp.]
MPAKRTPFTSMVGEDISEHRDQDGGTAIYFRAGGGVEWCGGIVAGEVNSPHEDKTALRCDECGLVAGTINTGILHDLITLALATAMVRYPPDPDHTNALPAPLRKDIHDLETRVDPAGNVAETAMLKENKCTSFGRVSRARKGPNSQL